MRDRKGVEKRKAGLTKGSTGATEARFLTLPKCSAVARSTQPLDPCDIELEKQGSGR